MKMYSLTQSLRGLKGSNFEKGEIALIHKNNKAIAVVIPYDVWINIQHFVATYLTYKEEHPELTSDAAGPQLMKKVATA